MVDGVQITVGEVTRPCVVPGQEPPSGHQWICYLLSLHNLSDETRVYGPEQFMLITSGGPAAGPLIDASLGDSLQPGVLAAGGAIAGVIRFEISAEAEAEVLRFAPIDGRGAASTEIPL